MVHKKGNKTTQCSAFLALIQRTALTQAGRGRAGEITWQGEYVVVYLSTSLVRLGLFTSLPTPEIARRLQHSFAITPQVLATLVFYCMPACLPASQPALSINNQKPWNKQHSNTKQQYTLSSLLFFVVPFSSSYFCFVFLLPLLLLFPSLCLLAFVVGCGCCHSAADARTDSYSKRGEGTFSN